MDQSTKLCARCGVNPRNSSLKSYCIGCKQALARESKERRGQWKKPQDRCSRCRGLRTGRHPSYCTPCTAEYRREAPCSRCGGPKVGRQGESRTGYCIPCFRKNWLMKNYGISTAQFDEILASQGGRCAICGGGGNGKAWHVDHCHETGKVRGVLCAKCNMALGLLGESAARLRAAADYLER
jgi:hypothetical protein